MKKNSTMAKTPLKSYSLEEIKDEFIGKRGTVAREDYEHELSMGILGHLIKKTRQERKLTQEQLGKLVGVQKAQISKLESSANSATIGTIVKVFKALNAGIWFNVKLKAEKTARKKIQGIIDPSVRNYEKDPFFCKEGQ
jgi:HTH-type transcriptional regulator / antitoxin HipB